MKRNIVLLLLFLPLVVFSQSVRIDGPTGRISDLVITTEPDSADLIILEHLDSSKYITYDAFSDHSGALAYVSTGGTQTIGTGGTFERLNEGAIAYTAGHLLHHFTHSDGRLTYIGTRLQHFTVIVSVTIEGDEANQLVQVRLAKNGSIIDGTNSQHDFRAVDTDAVLPFSWLLDLYTNEYIEIWGTSDTNGDTFFVHNITMTVIQH